MTTRDEFVEKLKRQIGQWNAQMSAREAKARDAVEKARSHFEKR